MNRSDLRLPIRCAHWMCLPGQTSSGQDLLTPLDGAIEQRVIPYRWTEHSWRTFCVSYEIMAMADHATETRCKFPAAATHKVNYSLLHRLTRMRIRVRYGR